MTLSFTEDTHEYRWGDHVVPSVTGIIGELRKVTLGRYEYFVNVFTSNVIDAETIRAAGDTGTAIHKACGIILEHGHDALDWDGLDPDLIPPLQQFEKWMEDWEPEIILVETPMYSKKYGYAGTSDIIARIPRLKKKVAVTDIKTGAFSMVGPQTSAYTQLYKEEYKDKSSIERAVLHLPKDGSDYTYKVLENHASDWNFFKARLAQHGYLKGKGY